jgi:hypothetical protein
VSHPSPLLPLRIPELGPSLGKLITGSGRNHGAICLDEVRHRLATRIIESAGEARRLAAKEERSDVIYTLSPVLWLSAWEETVSGVATILLERIRSRVTREAGAVRMPPKLRDRFFPAAADRRALSARLGSAGVGLVPALDVLARRGAEALTATAVERDAVERWQEALRTAAGRLEAAWLALEDHVDPELDRWNPAIGAVKRWKKSLVPVWIVGGLLLALAVWVGSVAGGFLPLPLPSIVRPLLYR